MPRDPATVEPLHTRSHRQVTCRHCGHTWATRRPPQSAAPCSQCRAAVWVPLRAPIVDDPAQLRQERQRQERANHRAQLRQERQRQEQEHADQIAALARLTDQVTALFVPTPAQPAPVKRPDIEPPAGPADRSWRAPGPPHPAQSVPTGAGPYAEPIPVGSPYEIGPDTARVLAAIGQRDYLTPVRAGDCPFYVVRIGVLCTSAAPYRVRLTAGAYLPACHGHAWAIQNQATAAQVPIRVHPPLN